MTSETTAITELALRHGIKLTGPVEVNDIGLDFRAVFATDEAGIAWVLRTPRRPDVLPRAENESRVLGLVKDRLPVAVPDWRVFTSELIAYPRLPGITALTIDPATKEPIWNIDRRSPVFTSSFGQALAALHTIPVADAAAAGLRVSSPEQVRRKLAEEIEQVEREVGIGEQLLKRWRMWLDNDALWPPFSALIHGDMYAGHVLVDEASRATGFLDWTEAEVGDPAADLCFHLMGFGEQGLDQLMNEYADAGGLTWPEMRRHVAERLSAVPLKYAYFALTIGSDEHLAAARAQLGAG